MAIGAFGENFPYTNFHDMNMDWLVKIAKDFLDQYTTIQQIISDGEELLTTTISNGVEELETKKDTLEGLLQDWYDTHSADIADQLADALSDLNSWYTTHQNYLDQTLASNILAFQNAADAKAAEAIATIPADYSELAIEVQYLNSLVYPSVNDDTIFRGGGSFNYKLNPSTGNWSSANDYFLASYMEVLPGETYVVNFPPDAECTVCAYPTNPQTTTITTFQTMINTGNKNSFTVPEGMYFLLMSFKTEYRTGASLAKPGMNDPLARKDISYLTNKNNLFTGNGSYNFKLNPANGQWVSASDYFLSTGMKVIPGKTYYTNLKRETICTVCLYNTDPAGETPSQFLTVINDGTKKFTVPSGYYYALMSFKVEYKDTALLAELTAQDNIARDRIDEITHTVTIGSTGDFQTLRAGIAYAYAKGNTKVVVLPGTYNLIEEFSAEISAGGDPTGIALGNGIYVYFCDGSKVTAVFDNSGSTYTSTQWRWIYDNFQPFYAGNGDYVLENLDILAKDCRYCVHDEMNGTGTARHEYLNCRMSYINTHDADLNYIQCIGGGLGEHTTIIIDGGAYHSTNNYGHQLQQPITYHNGSSATCDGSITIKNVYLDDEGYFRFGYYGESTTKTAILVCGCSMGGAIVKQAENPSATIDNFNLIEWNNTVRS